MSFCLVLKHIEVQSEGVQVILLEDWLVDWLISQLNWASIGHIT